MKLEFELDIIDRNDTRVIYTIKRKGLDVGLLKLSEPYNDINLEVKKTTLE